MLKVFICVILACLTITVQARADDRNSSWSEWRTIAHDGSYATSDCIGFFDSPDCIAETWAACDVLGFLKEGATESIPENYKPMCRHLVWGMGNVPAARLKSRNPFNDPAIYLYKIHTWTVLDQDVNEFLRTDFVTVDLPTKGLPRVLPGDTVLEFYPAGCHGQHECIDEQEAGERQVCPPTRCYGFDLLGPVNKDYLRIDCNSNPDPDGILIPLTFVVLRKVDGRWLIPYGYDASGSYRRTCDTSFMSDYWRKRK